MSLDKQVGGGHYKALSVQPITYIQSNKLDYCQGNVVKYVTRYPTKNGREDLEKAAHYCEFLLEYYTTHRWARVVRYVTAHPLLLRLQIDPRKYCNVNTIHGLPRKAIRLVSTWRTLANLKEAKHCVLTQAQLEYGDAHHGKAEA